MAIDTSNSDNLIKQAGAINLNTLSPDLAVKQKSDSSAFFGGQKQDLSGYLSKLYGFTDSQPTSMALQQRIGGELGIPQATGVAEGLNRTLFQLPSTYSAATTGYDVNNNQLSRIIGQKQSELAPSAALATQNVANLNASADKKMAAYQTDYQNRLSSYTAEAGLLNDRLAREATGFDQGQQHELDALIAKVQAGVTLTNSERSRAEDLAKAEEGYASQMAIAKLNNQNNIDVANINKPVWG